MVAGAASGLTALRIFIGVFFIFEGIGKIGWLADPSQLGRQLAGWMENAPWVSRWYLETIAIPGSPVFARLVMLGETSTGLAFLLGFGTRWAALAAFLMVMNFHFARGLLFEYQFLTNGYCLPVLGALLALVVGGAQLPWSLEKRLLGPAGEY